MKQITRISLASIAIIASTGIYTPCCAKPFICRAYDYTKKTVLLAAPYILANVTDKYILEKYGERDAFYQQENFKYLIFGAYAAYFWPKALHQKLK